MSDIVGNIASSQIDGDVKVKESIDGFIYPKGDTGNGIEKIEKTNSVGLEDTYTIYFTNGKTYTFVVTNGKEGKQGERGNQGEQGIQGPQGVQGIQGVPGKDFSISKTYPSITAMKADKENVEEGSFVIIASNEEDPDNAKLYVKDSTDFRFIADLSGAIGMKGEQGKQGIQGPQGIPGEKGEPGDVSLQQLNDATRTLQTTEVSEELEIKDCAGVNAKLDIVSGKSWQETREGYNKFDEVWSNGYYAQNGYLDNSASGCNSDNYIEIGDNKTIYLLVNVLQDFLLGRIFIVEFDETYNFIKRNQIPDIYDTNLKIGVYKYTTNLSENCKYIKLSLYVIHDTEGNSLRPTKDYYSQYLQICVSNNEVEQYEPYGAMPSLDYPSEIRNVGDNINLFDIDYFSDVNNYDGVDVYRYKLWKTLSKDTTFYVSTEFIGSNYKTLIFTISNNSNPDNSTKKINLVASGAGFNSGAITFKAGEKVYIGYFSPNFNISTLKTDYKIKIEEGKKATGYSPYGCGSIDFKLKDKSTNTKEISFPLGKGQVLHEGDYLADDGVHQVKETSELDGTEEWNEFTSKTNFFTNKFASSVGEVPMNTKILALCTHCLVTGFNYAKDQNFYFHSGNKNLQFMNNSLKYKDVSEWKSFLANQKAIGQPMLIEYELAEEKIVPYTPEQQEAYNKLQNLLLYEGYTKITCIDEMKPDIQVTYYFNNEINNTYAKRMDIMEERLRQLEELISSKSEVI